MLPRHGGRPRSSERKGGRGGHKLKETTEERQKEKNLLV